MKLWYEKLHLPFAWDAGGTDLETENFDPVFMVVGPLVAIALLVPISSPGVGLMALMRGVGLGRTLSGCSVRTLLRLRFVYASSFNTIFTCF